ncbi:Replication 1a [Gossypium arboreum]|uniref:Replication 1a n=1 Tax=Gossypium arboreum TaxID=29729 RepID=A0A0B0N8K7_GOSAR|nr:Replication 1a [Gossypium arboreum]
MISLFVYGLLSFGKLTLCVFQLFCRYRSYWEFRDYQGSSPHYRTIFWYLLKM